MADQVQLFSRRERLTLEIAKNPFEERVAGRSRRWDDIEKDPAAPDEQAHIGIRKHEVGAQIAP